MKSRAEEATEDCSRTKCSDCGVCDFKEVKPVIFKKGDCRAPLAMTDAVNGRCHCEEHERRSNPPSENSSSLQSQSGNAQPIIYKYSINFTKTEEASLLGHLDLMNVMKRSMRRADFPMRYSEGYNPRPKISFPTSLSLGIESLDEWCEIELLEKVDPEKLKQDLNKSLPKGITIKSVAEGKAKPAESVFYVLKDPAPGRVEEFYAADQVTVSRTTKKGIREIDLKKSVKSLAETEDGMIRVELASGGGNVYDFAVWLYGVETKEARFLEITKEKTCLMN